MANQLSEIQIFPVKPKDGLIAFASFVLNKDWYMGNVAVITRLTGGYRLVYPTKNERPVFYPLSKELGNCIEEEVTKKLEEVTKYD